MTFYDRLTEATAARRQELYDIPLLQQGVQGQVSLSTYVAFLREAYHHVRHTVPLLMACGARLPSHYEWLREAIARYIEEELGHQEWILNDIAACGADAETVRAGKPGLATEVMVAYAWDTIQRGNPLGFFGMVYVLEGTSVMLATHAATALAATLSLPDSAFTYLKSHGALDVEHIDHFAALMNRMTDNADQQAILHAAGVFFVLYGNIFRSLDERNRDARGNAAPGGDKEEA